MYSPGRNFFLPFIYPFIPVSPHSALRYFFCRKNRRQAGTENSGRISTGAGYEQRRQKSGNLREKSQQEETNRQGGQKRPDPLKNHFQRYILGHALNNIDVHPHRRRNDPHGHDHDDDYSEPHGIITEDIDNKREKNRNGQQNQGQGIYKTTQNKVDQKNNSQN